ncbi:hypothetical protein K402DRAFT_117291 [Aulographum hederae CBS 113979]|uniref:Secreted protein n=1 Tax=Aulographum hederae CBS 113979 TaxID=1176131 RepID=A0A6G1GVW1_9PEZI|nr:hypothetical protein K402DRAFT_117291 [Aulographum hederae CBS 113979]
MGLAVGIMVVVDLVLDLLVAVSGPDHSSGGLSMFCMCDHIYKMGSFLTSFSDSVCQLTRAFISSSQSFSEFSFSPFSDTLSVYRLSLFYSYYPYSSYSSSLYTT